MWTLELAKGGERMVEEMTEKELANFLLDKLSDLERVEHAPNRDDEIAYQKKYLLAKLQSLGVPTEEIVQHK